MIRFACPNCLTTYDYSDREAGMKFACGTCGQRLQVPAPPCAASPVRRAAAPVSAEADEFAPEAVADTPRPPRRPLFWLAVVGGCGSLAIVGSVLLFLWAINRNNPPPAPASGSEASSGGDPTSTTPENPTTALARKANDLLKTNCYRCHGENGAAEGGFNYVLDRDKLVARKKVVPGDPDRSKLYRRVSKGEMPPSDEGGPLGADAVAVLKRWIEAGARPRKSLIAPILSPTRDSPT